MGSGWNGDFRNKRPLAERDGTVFEAPDRLNPDWGSNQREHIFYLAEHPLASGGADAL
jgi:hypothetical protein